MNASFLRNVWTLAMLVAISASSAIAQKMEQFFTPKSKISQTILSHKDVMGKNYLAFPALLRLSDDQVLITFKRGTSHGSDKEADCDLITFNTVSNKIVQHQTLGSIPDKKFQLTVPVRLASGEIRYYTDMQNQGQDNKNYREGMHYTEAYVAGKAPKWRKLDLIGGIEYGYPFDFIVEGKVVNMLAMSFGYRPGSTWSVAVLRSDDGAKSWKFVKDITAALGGGAINESSFVKVGSDYFVVCRGYLPQTTRIARFDAKFNLLKVADLTGKDKTLSNTIGWPRIFYKDNQLYIMGRIWPNIPGQPLPIQGMKDSRLGLMRINPELLAVEKIALLDNADAAEPVKDAYYAAPYWQTVGGVSWFNAITYKSVGTAEAPDIIRLAFPWHEVK